MYSTSYIVKMVTIVFLLNLIVGFSSSNALSLNLKINSLNSESNLKYIEDRLSITAAEEDEFVRGLNMFGLFQGSLDENLKLNNSYLALLDMDGKFVKSPLVSNTNYDFSEQSWINSTTILTNYNLQPLFWNILTNATQQFNFVEGEIIDSKYNPSTNSFMVLESSIGIINSTVSNETVIIDSLSEYAISGARLWSSNITDIIGGNVSHYYQNLNIFNASVHLKEYNGTLYPDVTNTNSLFWDFTNNLIYFNVGYLNQIVKLEYITKSVEWVAGQATDFTLFNQTGNETESLWYDSNDITPLGNDEFLIFDNDYHNITDPFGNLTRSNLLKIKVDAESRVINETSRWFGPQVYTSTFWGSARILPNDNYLIGFGAPIHSNLTLPMHTAFGGVAVELNSDGEKVWELRLPFNWGFKKIQRVIPIITVTPAAAVAVNVGERVDLSWGDPFSNFPDSFAITFNNDNELDSGDWNNEIISYSLNTDGLREGDHIIALTLKDKAGNEKTVATKITVLALETSKKDDTPILGFGFILSILPIILFKRKKLI